MDPSVLRRVRWSNVAAAGLLVACLAALVTRPALGPEPPVTAMEEAVATPPARPVATPAATAAASPPRPSRTGPSRPRGRSRGRLTAPPHPRRRTRRPYRRAAVAPARPAPARSAPVPPPARGEFGFER